MLVSVFNVVVLEVFHVVHVLEVDFGIEGNKLGNGGVT